MNEITAYNLKQELDEFAKNRIDSDIRSLLTHLNGKNVLIGTKKDSKDQMMIVEDLVSHTGFYIPVFTEIDEIPEIILNRFDWYVTPLNSVYALMRETNNSERLDVDGIIINPNTHNIVISNYINEKNTPYVS